VPKNLPYYEFTVNRLHLFQPLAYHGHNYGIIYFQLSSDELNAKIRIYLSKKAKNTPQLAAIGSFI
jgi:hypothetical protein